MKYMLTKIVSSILLVIFLSFNALATPIDTYQFKTQADQDRAISLASELRCPQCQNQNLVDSNSPVARDLRIQVYKMVDEGKNDNDIIDFMTSRYGEFVLYKPKFESKTFILWAGPFVLLIIGFVIGFIFIRHQRIGRDNEPDMSDEDKKQLATLLKQAKK